jgi:hypothetical protein
MVNRSSEKLRKFFPEVIKDIPLDSVRLFISFQETLAWMKDHGVEGFRVWFL